MDGIDLKASTIRLDIEDESILEHFERDETETPSPQKIAGDRIIYTSRIMGLPNRVGHPVICDFGEARHGNEENDDDIQPEIYRAPEVILEIPWTYSVDIWNVGVMVSHPHPRFIKYDMCRMIFDLSIECKFRDNLRRGSYDLLTSDRSGISSKTSICLTA